jgi:hypothetical protein
MFAALSVAGKTAYPVVYDYYVRIKAVKKIMERLEGTDGSAG